MYILVIQSDDRHVVDTVGPFNTESEAKHAKATIQVNPTFNRYCDGYHFTVMPIATVEATVESYETLWNDTKETESLEDAVNRSRRCTNPA